jgi:murein DD-endopeptidase MepM/ murein hydrolase activator NlpD
MTEPIFEISFYDPRTQQMRARLHPSAREEPRPWRWPLVRCGGRDPLVLAEYETHDRRGVDLGYAAAPFDNELYVPVYAARSGEVSFAAEGKHGFAVSIDHGDFTTAYGHLSKMFVTRCLGRTRRRQDVRAGDVIGYAAKAPLHVRFELWRWTEDRGFVATDPLPSLREWPLASPDGELRATATTTAHEAA